MKRSHLFRNTQVQGGATRRNDGFVSQLPNQKKTGNKNNKKKKPTPPVRTQDIRETGEDDPPPYDPNADTGPAEISLNRDPVIPTLPHLPPRAPVPSNTGPAPQTAGSTNPIQDSTLTGNESSTLHTDPTNPSNNTSEHRQEGGDTPTDPTAGQGEDNSNVAPETNTERPPATQVTASTPASLTDKNQLPTQNHTPVGNTSQTPAATTLSHTPEEPTTPSVDTTPVVPNNTLSTAPPETPAEWDVEMAEEVDKTTEQDLNTTSSREAAQRLLEEPAHPTWIPPEEPGLASQGPPRAPEHPPQDNQDKPIQQVPDLAPDTPQQQIPATPLATVRPFTHNQQESALTTTPTNTRNQTQDITTPAPATSQE